MQLLKTPHTLRYHVFVEERVNKKRSAGCALLYASAAAALLMLALVAFGGWSHAQSALLGGLIIAALFSLGAWLYISAWTEEAQRRKAARTLQWACFGAYLLALSLALFALRIDWQHYAADRIFYFQNLKLFTNFVPLKTILLYLRCLKYGYIGTSIPLGNLMGNLLLFAPMAALLPALFPSMRQFWKYLLLMAAILAAVEALQLALSCGSCDVDDVILNLVGATLCYGVCRLPPVKRLLERLYLL